MAYPAFLRRFRPMTIARAAADTGSTIVGTVARAGKVTAVTYMPTASITGANTNSRTVSLVNKGANGAGNTTIASLAFTSGVNASAFQPVTVPLSGTPANLNVAAGDILAWVSTSVGTGLADPGGQANVAVQPN